MASRPETSGVVAETPARLLSRWQSTATALTYGPDGYIERLPALVQREHDVMRRMAGELASLLGYPMVGVYPYAPPRAYAGERGQWPAGPPTAAVDASVRLYNAAIDQIERELAIATGNHLAAIDHAEHKAYAAGNLAMRAHLERCGWAVRS